MTSTVDYSQITGSVAGPDSNQVEDALSSLAAPLREVLVLRECRGWGYEQIAQTLNVPRSVVYQRIADARREMLRLVR